MNKKYCEGCEIEMIECYNYQREGFDAGLEFSKSYGVDGENHCYFFVLNKRGEIIVE